MQRLIEKGIIKPEDIEGNTIPWISHLVIFISTFLGGVGIIFVLGIMRIINEDTLWIFGLMALGGAIFIAKGGKKTIENYYTTLMLIIAGEIAFIVGLKVVSSLDTTAMLLWLASLQIVLFFTIDDYIQRVHNITLFTLAFVFISQNATGIYFMIMLFTLLYSGIVLHMVFEQKRYFTQAWFYHIKDALILNLLILTFLPFGLHHLSTELTGLKITFTFFASILALFTLYRLLNLYDVGNQIAIYTLSILLMIAFYPTPALIIAFMLLALCSYQNDKLLMVVWLVTSVIFIGYWYYSLEFSLLYKSLSMMVVGLIMLGSYYLRRMHA